MKKLYDKLITDHYNSVAAKFKKSKLSTMNDVYVRNEETKFILSTIKRSKKKLKILDIGCGNGYTLSQISNLKRHHLFGMENNFSLYKICAKYAGKFNDWGKHIQRRLKKDLVLVKLLVKKLYF